MLTFFASARYYLIDSTWHSPLLLLTLVDPCGVVAVLLAARGIVKPATSRIHCHLYRHISEH
jgi:hypothetical protein